MANVNLIDSSTIEIEQTNNDIQMNITDAFLGTIFPIGSIIIKDDSTDYSTWLGFTWTKVFAGKVLVGQDTSDTDFDTIGETGGEKTHTLTIDEIPSHSHLQYVGANTGTWGVRIDYNSDANCDAFPQGQTGSAGGGEAHNNLQPYQVVAYWKRTA